jgi:hypothetical protein
MFALESGFIALPSGYLQQFFSSPLFEMQIGL